MKEFSDLLNKHIKSVTRKFLEQGYYIAVSNIIAMLGYGAQDNPLMIAIDDASQNVSDPKIAVKIDEKAMESFQNAQYLATEVIKIVLKRIRDPNILPFIHVTLAFMKFMSRRPRAMQYLAPDFPWQLLVDILNSFMEAYLTPDRIEDDAFPVPVKDHIRPFTEDFAMRGLTWAEGYFPPTWFSDDKLDDEERYLEVASMANKRRKRILWLACSIADAGSWISYDRVSRRFSASASSDTPSPASSPSLPPPAYTPASSSSSSLSAYTIISSGLHSRVFLISFTISFTFYLHVYYYICRD